MSRNTLAEGGADSTNSTSEKVVDDGTYGACEWPVVPTKIILKEQIWAFLQVRLAPTQANQNKRCICYVPIANLIVNQILIAPYWYHIS